MKRTALTLTLILLLLFFVVAGAQVVEVVKAVFSGPRPPDLPIFYVRGDGAIDPPSAPLSQSGDTYSLTDNIVDYTIEIQKDNLILDGGGYSIQASPVDIPPASSIPIGWHPAIHLNGTNNVTVKNVKLQGCYTAIYVEESKNITIINNDVVGNVYGVVMLGSFNTTIIGNNMTNGSTGIIFYGSSINTIVENDISSNIIGIYFRGASIFSNCITINNLTANTGHAIFFDGGVANNSIIQNVIAYNKIGIGNGLSTFRNCTIYSNNFVKNNESLQIEGSEAAWDNGSMGNYWSKYTGVDVNGDGIGDTPYVIDAANEDRFPLMNPWDLVVPFDTGPPQILVSSPMHKVYNVSSVPLTFQIYEASSSMSYYLDGQENVSISGNTTLSELPNGAHNLTVYVTDNSGNTGVSDAIHFSVEVPEPFPTLLVIAITILVVAIVAVSLLVYFKKNKR